MTYLLAIFQLILSVTFGMSALAKAVQPAAFVQSLRSAGLHLFTASILRDAIPVIEIILAGFLISGSHVALSAGLYGTIVVLMAFTAWISWLLVRRPGSTCGCFGARQRQLRPTSLIRNALLMAVAVGALAAARQAASPLPKLSLLPPLLFGGLLLTLKIRTSWASRANSAHNIRDGKSHHLCTGGGTST
jgi:Methylamine utilisation protein MauE